MKKAFKKYYFDIILMLPLTLYVLGFTITPTIRTILLSFKDERTGAWGLDVYRNLFQRPDFISATTNTIVVTIIGLSIQLVFGLIIAMVIKEKFAGKGLVRSIVLIPMGIPTLVSGVALLYVFGTSGYLNSFLFKLGIIDIPVNWSSGGIGTLFMVAVADTWKVVPFVALLILAGLEAIPGEIYESCDIDGASKIQTFFCVTLPILKPTITMTVLLRAIDAFKIFELPMVLVGRIVPFLSTYAYDEFGYGKLNTSAAVSTVLLLMIVSFIILYMRFIDKGGEVT